MKKCLKCHKEMPPDSKAVLCEHCRSEAAEGAKNVLKCLAVAGLTVLAVITKGKFGSKE